jgi:hypothetical protein
MNISPELRTLYALMRVFIYVFLPFLFFFSFNLIIRPFVRSPLFPIPNQAAELF